MKYSQGRSTSSGSVPAEVTRNINVIYNQTHSFSLTLGVVFPFSYINCYIAHMYIYVYRSNSYWQ